MDQSLITRIVEAALLAAHHPLTLVQLRGLFTLDEPAPDGSIEQALADLREQCAGRGVELSETASGFRFQVQADVHPWVARLWTERQTKYTRATLETLAIIAYRQPITRGEIEQVRGVAVSSNIIKALEEREWIRTVGHRDMPGRPELLGTTKTFLDYFGLKSLDELPPLSELKDFGELDPQLSFADPDAPPPAVGAAIAAGVRDGQRSQGGGGANAEAAPPAEEARSDEDDLSDRSASDDGLDDDTATDHGAEPGSPSHDHDHDHEHDSANDADASNAEPTPDTTALVADDDSTGA